jgi:hypothetical protein
VKGLFKVKAHHNPVWLRAEPNGVSNPDDLDYPAVCHLCYSDHHVLLSVYVCIIAFWAILVNRNIVGFLQQKTLLWAGFLWFFCDILSQN